MTREEAINRLNAINDKLMAMGSGYDGEDGHWEADAVLLILLRSLGYDDVADAWCSIPKWYS